MAAHSFWHSLKITILKTTNITWEVGYLNPLF
ncbi:hypothetical protein MiTe_04325 [Microcystis aeruginosa NIES-2520]|uniref:Uncharacterized protein n=1 Tax=Microcystis aeruginosa NIES-2520 TaxID=2303982 RepID=A0A5A5RMW1_MICAE|nr:hypothetical protein MiTe_04325 [Microcystis aeruginosa NIES-2520]